MVTTRAVRATTKRSASAASPLLNGDEAFTPGSSSSSSREGTMGALQTPSTATSSSPSHPGEPRPMYGLASFADLDHALAGVADTPSCGSLPTGIAVPSASPPASVADLACDPLLAPNAARPGKAVSEVGPESPSRRVSSRSAGPAVMPRRTGICKFFNAQKVSPSRPCSSPKSPAHACSHRASALSSTMPRKSSATSKVHCRRHGAFRSTYRAREVDK